MREGSAWLRYEGEGKGGGRDRGDRKRSRFVEEEQQEKNEGVEDSRNEGVYTECRKICGRVRVDD